MDKLQIQLLNSEAIAPTRAYAEDVGWDIYSLASIKIRPGATVPITTGIAIRPPKGCFAKILGRSGLALKGLEVMGGVIDPGYTGEIKVLLNHHGGATTEPIEIKKGDKIAQIVLLKYEEADAIIVDQLNNTERSAKGFGSSDLETSQV